MDKGRREIKEPPEWMALSILLYIRNYSSLVQLVLSMRKYERTLARTLNGAGDNYACDKKE